MAPFDPSRLVFVISAPRSGSTLLQRMLASHPAVSTHPEPHLLTPLAYLGYFDTVDAAPFDHVNAAAALREFCAALPRGEEDYLDALRAYALTLYGRVAAPSGRPTFVDKTPAYGLVLPFVRRLFPQAAYVILTRHPLAILHSQAQAFFGGDLARAARTNPLLPRYVPALASCLRQPPARAVHVVYEELVTAPEATMRHVLAALGLAYDPAVIAYGEQAHVVKSFGDPVGVGRHRRPMAAHAGAWRGDLAARPEALAAGVAAAAELADADLEIWGTPRAHLFDGVAAATPAPTRRRLDAYRLRRAALLAARAQVPRLRLHGPLRRLRYACDLLLRDAT